MISPEFALESSLLVLMILGIRKMFTGKIRYAGIYALWFLVLLRFLVPVNLFSTPLGIGVIIPDTVLSQDNSVSQKGYSGEVPETEALLEDALSEEAFGKSSELEWQGNGGDVAASAQGTAEKQSSGFWRFLELRGADLKMIFVRVRFAVAGILFLWFVCSNVVMVRRLKKKRIFCGKKGKLNIYLAPHISNPCLYGFFQPSIYLPKGLISEDGKRLADEEEVEQIITHEYVHYCHGDHIWAMFRMLFVCLYWFDPFLWLAVSYSKKDAELFCDETVVRLLGEEKRFCYGNMLVRLAGESSWGEFRYPLMSMSRRGKEMEKRIRAISSKKSYSRWLLLPLLMLVLIAVGITCSNGIQPKAEETKEEQGETSAEGTASEDGAGTVSDLKAGTQYSGDGKLVSGDANGNAVYDGSAIEDINATADGAAIKEMFDQYINLFTGAVNTGNTEELNQVLAETSEVYGQQCEIVKNYYNRGIREKVKAYSIASFHVITPTLVNIESKEKIRVSYGDDTTKMVRQQYQYTCELIEGRWMITGMEDLEGGNEEDA